LGSTIVKEANQCLTLNSTSIHIKTNLEQKTKKQKKKKPYSSAIEVGKLNPFFDFDLDFDLFEILPIFKNKFNSAKKFNFI